MKPKDSRMLAVISRNFSEADSALLKLAAYNSLHHANFGATGMRFFAIAHAALYNDMIAGAIRIFDDHKEAGSLWYIVRCNEPAARRAAQACGVDLEELRKMVPKLRHVRDKIHFHIDRRAVENPSLVWRDADFSGDELANALRQAALLLAKIKQDAYGGMLEQLTAYDGSDVSRIVGVCIAENVQAIDN